MKTWIIEPRDPLIVRDGRPFGPDPGARAKTLNFPFPSTTTGGVRTRAGLNGNGFFDNAKLAWVKQIKVRGPLLVELDEQGQVQHWFAPAPADALLFPAAANKQVLRRQLRVLKPAASAEMNLSDGLQPVGVYPLEKRKPEKAPPAFWHWPAYEKWLVSPQDCQTVTLDELGWTGPVRDQRIHVRILAESLTADEGALFQTSGLEFTRLAEPLKKTGHLAQARRLALAVQTDESLPAGLAPLGGERRIVHWRPGAGDNLWPQLPAALEAGMDQQPFPCRLLLLTPALFERGYRPGWLLEAREGVQPELVAAVVARPQVVSGWNFETDQPKPTRRLAPAGSVYFLKLHGDSAAIKNWLKTMWMASISDREQDRRDGFGLAVLGNWDGSEEEVK